jgi:hypothetical protein
MISEKQYYADKRVSSSSLKWFLESPKMFRKQLDKEIAQIQKSWLNTGRQIHMSILEPKLFDKSYIYLDYDIPKSQNQKDFCEEYVNLANKFVDEARKTEAYTKAYTTKGKSEDKIKEESQKLYNQLAKYIDYLEKSKDYKEVMSKSKWDLIQNLKEESHLHKKSSELLFDTVKNELDENYESYNEQVIFWDYPQKGKDKIECKSMVDRFVIDKKNKIIKLIDIKTTSDLGSFKNSVDKYRYHRQLMFYWLAIYYEYKELIPNIDEYKQETYIIALSTNPELPECKAIQIDENLLHEGMKEIEAVMTDIGWHYENNLWDYSREYYEGDGTESLVPIEELDTE